MFAGIKIQVNTCKIQVNTFCLAALVGVLYLPHSCTVLGIFLICLVLNMHDVINQQSSDASLLNFAEKSNNLLRQCRIKWGTQLLFIWNSEHRPTCFGTVSIDL